MRMPGLGGGRWGYFWGFFSNFFAVTIGIEEDHAQRHEDGVEVEDELVGETEPPNLQHPAGGEDDEDDAQQLDEEQADEEEVVLRQGGEDGLGDGAEAGRFTTAPASLIRSMALVV